MLGSCTFIEHMRRLNGIAQITSSEISAHFAVLSITWRSPHCLSGRAHCLTEQMDGHTGDFSCSKQNST